MFVSEIKTYLTLTNMKKTITTLIAGFFTILGFSQTFISYGITYELVSGSNNTVNAIDYNTAFGLQVTVPKTVTNPSTNSKYGVIGVSADAFKSKGLTGLVLSEGLLTIGNRAFYDNAIAGTLIIPNTVTNIEAHAFNVNQIDSLVLGDGIQYILSQSFANNNLASLIIPSNVVFIDWAVFGDNNIATVTIENGVGTIGARAFWGNPLTTVISESSVPPTITTGGNEDTFNTTGPTNDDRSNIDLFIPVNTSGVYVTNPGATWTGFKSVTEITVTSVFENTLNRGIDIYPNPVTSELTIDSKENFNTLKIIDLTGKTVKMISSQDHTVNVSDLEIGIYILQIQGDNGKAISKFIKK